MQVRDNLYSRPDWVKFFAAKLSANEIAKADSPNSTTQIANANYPVFVKKKQNKKKKKKKKKKTRCSVYLVILYLSLRRAVRWINPV